MIIMDATVFNPLPFSEKMYALTLLIKLLLFCHAGILVNKDGIPEEEENFDEAIKAVNMALVPTRVMYSYLNCLLK